MDFLVGTVIVIAALVYVVITPLVAFHNYKEYK